jgi:NAD(P)H-dependent FMN reductase
MIPVISIISSSARTGRNSHRAALYFQSYITEHKLANCEILDLKSYQFPIFDERLRLQKNPSPAMLEFAEKVKNSDGIIIVTPEYNGGYPASLKNAVDLLYEEWHRKPIAIATASDGDFGRDSGHYLLAVFFVENKSLDGSGHVPDSKSSGNF